MKEKTYNVMLNIYFTLLLSFLFIASVLYTYNKVDNDFISNNLVILGSIGIALYIFYKLVIKKVKIHDVFVLLMSFLGYLSYYNAYDQRVALIGFFGRREGLLVILTYYIIFLLGTTVGNRKIQKRIFNFLILIGLLNFFVALLQAYNVESLFGIKIMPGDMYSNGFLSNSNFFGSFSTIMFGLVLGKYFFETLTLNLKNTLLLFIFEISVIISGAMSSYVTILMLVLFLMIYYGIKIKKYNIKHIVCKFLILLLMFFSTLLIINRTTEYKVINDVKEMNSQAISSVSGEVGDNFGTGRIYIWKEAIKYVPEYLLTGVGIDNFAYLGKGVYIRNPVSNAIVDKAHNEYLQILLTEGIFMLITYILFLSWIGIKALIKILKSNNDNYLFISFSLAFVGYVMQAFLNISITRVAPLFFLCTGLVVVNSEEKE